MTNWDEKYKPSSMTEMVGQENIISYGKRIVERKNMKKHLLLTGSPGLGKTSFTKALAQSLYGSHWKNNLTTFNASKDRGINFVRDTLSEITSIVPVGAPFRLVFLDEADAMTQDAQWALREVMQAHTETCKFILGCNYLYKIISPIQDRCRVLRFIPIAPEAMLPRLRHIAQEELVAIEDGALLYLAQRSSGSMRKAIELLEDYDGVDKVTLDTVKKDHPQVEKDISTKILSYALKGEVTSYESELFRLHYAGFQHSEILDGLLNAVDASKLPENNKIRAITLIGEYDWRITQGSDSLLQMRCLLHQLGGIL